LATPASVRAAIVANETSDDGVYRIPQPSRAEILAALVKEAQQRQRDACEQILDLRKQRWAVSASGIAAKVSFQHALDPHAGDKGSALP
jgi:hypothetical protein